MLGSAIRSAAAVSHSYSQKTNQSGANSPQSIRQSPSMRCCSPRSAEIGIPWANKKLEAAIRQPSEHDRSTRVFKTTLSQRRQIDPFHSIVFMPCQRSIIPPAFAGAERRIAYCHDLLRFIVIVEFESKKAMSAARKLELIARATLQPLDLDPHLFEMLRRNCGIYPIGLWRRFHIILNFSGWGAPSSQSRVRGKQFGRENARTLRQG
jgi:hypothetical protein